jgi:hypothetical protein
MFENDHKMPLYGQLEFEAAARYLELLTNVAEAKKFGFHSVVSGYETLDLPQAQARLPGYRHDFEARVLEETSERMPGAKEHELKERARKRGHDILASLLDTGYVAPDTQNR